LSSSEVVNHLERLGFAENKIHLMLDSSGETHNKLLQNVSGVNRDILKPRSGRETQNGIMLQRMDEAKDALRSIIKLELKKVQRGLKF